MLQPKYLELNLMGVPKRNLLLCALLACMALLSAGRLFAQQERIFWFSNYDEAIQEAKKTQKPIFLEIRCEA